MKSVWNMSPQFEQKQQHRQARRAASACTPTGLAGLSFRPAPFAPHERLPPLLFGYLLSMFSMVKGNFCLSVLMSPSMLEGNLNHERRRSRHFYFSPHHQQLQAARLRLHNSVSDPYSEIGRQKKKVKL